MYEQKSQEILTFVSAQIEQWSDNLKTNRIKQNIQSTIHLIQNFHDPIICSYLISEKAKFFEMTAFTTILTNILENAQKLYKQLLVTNFKRIIQQKSIIKSLFDQVQNQKSNAIYEGSLILMEHKIRKLDQKLKIKKYFNNLKIKEDEIFIENKEQEIEQSAELMKFFEGIRNYQNQEEQVEKKVFQKLRFFKNQKIKEYNLNKGYKIRIIVQKLNKLVKSNKEQLFKINKKSKKLWKFSQFIKTKAKNNQLYFFDQYARKLDSTNTSKSIFNKFINNLIRNQYKLFVNSIRQFKKAHSKLNQGCKIIENMFKSHSRYYTKAFMQKFTYKQSKILQISCEFINRSLKYRQNLLKHWIKKWKNKTHITKKPFIRLFIKKISEKLRFCIQTLQKNTQSSKKIVKLSQKMKAKILLAAVKHTTPVNIKKSFFKWYIKANHNIISNSFVHMYMYAPISRFTVFTRMKNFIKQKKQIKIRNQVRLFLMLFLNNSKRFLQYKMRQKLNKWRVDNRKVNLMQNFANKINNQINYFNHIHLKLSFDNFAANLQQSNIKKRLFNIMAEYQAKDIRKCLYRWKKIPNIRKIQKQVALKKIIKTKIKESLKLKHDSFQSFLKSYESGYLKKLELLKKSFALDNFYVQRYFLKWRHNKNMWIENKITSRKQAIKQLENLINQCDKYNIKKVIKIFQKKIKYHLILRNFSKFIMNRLTSHIKTSYSKIKQRINTDSNKKNQAIKFQIKLSKFFNHQLINTFHSFLKDNNQANYKKNQLVTKLYHSIENKLKNAITRLQQNKQISLSATRNRQVINAFQGLEKIIKYTCCYNFLENRDNINEKKRYLEMLTKNQQKRISKYISRWSNQIRLQKNNLVNKKTNLLNFVNIFQINRQKNIKNLFQMFKRIAIKRKIMNKLLGSKCGKIVAAVQNWKNIPQRADIERRIKGSKFYEGIKKFIFNKISVSIEAFKKQKYQGEYKKKKCMNIMLEKTGDIRKKKLLFWKHENDTINKQLQCRFLMSSFENILGVYRTNMLMVMQNPSQWAIKQRSFLRLSKNLQANKKQVLYIWKSYAKVLTFNKHTSNQKKIQCTKILQSAIRSNKFKQIIQVIKKFEKNARIAQIQKNFFAKLFDSQYGKVIKSIMIWKNLPKMQNSEQVIRATRFQKKLQSMLMFNLKQTLKSFKSGKDDGNVKKKDSMKVLIYKCSKGIQKYFERWKVDSKRNKIMMTCNKTQEIFKLIQKKLYSNYQPLFDLEKTIKLKILLGKIIKQNNLYSYYRQWKKINYNHKKFIECKLSLNIFMSLNDTIKKITDPIFDCKQYKIKSKAISQLVLNWNQNLKFACLKLRIHKQNSKKLQVQKKNAILGIIQYANISQKSQQTNLVLTTIQKFRQRAGIIKILSKIYHKLGATGIGKIYTVIDSWKRIPNSKIQQKKRIITRTINKSLQGIRTQLKQTIQIFKHYNQQGTYKKRSALIHMINATSSNMQKYFKKWNQNFKTHKTLMICKKSEQLFQSLTFVTRAQLQIVFQNQRMAHLKQKYFGKFIESQRNFVKSGFKLWLDNARKIRLNRQMSVQNQKLMITQIHKLVNSQTNNQIRNSIRAFYDNYRIKSIQGQFIKKLLQTKSGLVVEFFKRLKTLPQIQLKAKVKSVQKLFFTLKSISNANLNLGFRPFKDCLSDGQILKKRAVIQLLEKTSSGIRKYFSRWIKDSRNHKILTISKLTHTFLQNLNQSVSMNMNLVFENQRSYRLKQKMILRLIQNTSAALGGVLKKWNQTTKILNIQKRLDNQKKTYMIQLIQSSVHNNSQVRIKEIFQQFYLNYKISAIAKNFLEKLLRTKGGMIGKAVEEWKQLPKPGFNQKKINAMKFQKGLGYLVEKKLRFSINIFKEFHTEGESKKKYCIRRLLQKSMSSQHKKFLHWRDISREIALIQKTRRLSKLFQISQNHLAKTLKENLINDTSIQLLTKRKICQKLINNSSHIQNHAFCIWIETYRNDNYKIQVQKSINKDNLKNMIQIFNQVSKTNLNKVINLFKYKLLKDERKKKLYEIMERNARSDVKKCLINWLQIPDNTNKLLKQKISFQFFEKISKFINNQMSYGYNQIKRQYQQYSIVRRINSVEKCYFNLFEVAQNNLLNIFRNQREGQIMERAINRLVENTVRRIKNSISLWQSNTKKIALKFNVDNQKKRYLIKMLSTTVSHFQHGYVPQVIKLFYKNYKIEAIQRKALQKILDTKSGKLIRYLNEWKTIPDQKEISLRAKASIFERGLDKFAKSKLKFAFDPFKEEIYNGSNKKKLAARKLLLITMSQSNKLFNRWKKVNNQQKIIQKSHKMQNLMRTLNHTLSDNLNYIFKNKTELSHKYRLIEKLCFNNKFIVYQGFDIWRGITLGHRKQKIKQKLNRISLISNGYRQERQVFMLFKKNHQMNILRNYINSLWRWKTSNIQAQYYSRFIKIFRESEQLLSFSKIINLKINNTISQAFSKIKSLHSKSSTHRIDIVIKYLQKRAHNYFNTFKNRINQNEIGHWKGKFKLSIKGMFVLQAFQKTNRKYLCYIMKKWNTKSKLLKKKIRSLKLLQQFMKKFLKYNFDNIKATSQKLIFEHKLSKITKLFITSLKSSFKNVKNTSKINKGSFILTKYINNQLYYALKNIQRRSTNRPLITHQIDALNQLIVINQQNITKSIINLLKLRNKRHQTLKSIVQKYEKKSLELQENGFKKFKQIYKNEILLKKFKGTTKICSFLQKMVLNTVSREFQKLKESKQIQNPWIKKCLFYFATKTSINTSLAVSMWRLKASIPEQNS